MRTGLLIGLSALAFAATPAAAVPADFKTKADAYL